MNSKQLCITFAILCLGSNLRAMLILDDDKPHISAAMNNSEANITDEHKKTARTMLQEAYRAHKEPSWPDLHEDDIKIQVYKNDRILVSGIVDLSNCILHDVSYPEIEVRIHRGQIEVTKPYGIIGDPQLKCWAMACIIGIESLCTASVYGWRTLSSYCKRNPARISRNHLD